MNGSGGSKLVGLTSRCDAGLEVLRECLLFVLDTKIDADSGQLWSNLVAAKDILTGCPKLANSHVCQSFVRLVIFGLHYGLLTLRDVDDIVAPTVKSFGSPLTFQVCSDTLYRLVQLLELLLTLEQTPSGQLEALTKALLIFASHGYSDNATSNYDLVFKAFDKALELLLSVFSERPELVPFIRSLLRFCADLSLEFYDRWRQKLISVIRELGGLHSGACLKLLVVCFDDIFCAQTTDEMLMQIGKPSFVNGDFEEAAVVRPTNQRTRKRHLPKASDAQVLLNSFPDAQKQARGLANTSRIASALKLVDEDYFGELIQGGLVASCATSNKYALFTLKRIIELQTFAGLENAVNFTKAGSSKKDFSTLWAEWFVLYEVLNEKTGHLVESMLPRLGGFQLQLMGSSWYLTLMKTGLAVDLLPVRKMLLVQVIGLDSQQLEHISLETVFWINYFYKECLHISYYAMSGTGNYVSEFGGLLSQFTARLLSLNRQLSPSLLRFVCACSSQLCTLFVLQGFLAVELQLPPTWANEELLAINDFLQNSNVLLQTSSEIVSVYAGYIANALHKHLDFSKVRFDVLCVTISSLVGCSNSYAAVVTASHLVNEYPNFKDILHQRAADRTIDAADLGHAAASVNVTLHCSEWELPPATLAAIKKAKVVERYVDRRLISYAFKTLCVFLQHLNQASVEGQKSIACKSLTPFLGNAVQYALYESRSACEEGDWNLLLVYMNFLQVLYFTRQHTDTNTLAEALNPVDSGLNVVADSLLALRYVWLASILGAVNFAPLDCTSTYLLTLSVPRWQRDFEQFLPNDDSYVKISEWGSLVVANFVKLKWKSIVSFTRLTRPSLCNQMLLQYLIDEIKLCTAENEVELLNLTCNLLSDFPSLDENFLEECRSWLLEYLNAQSLQCVRSKHAKRIIKKICKITVVISLISKNTFGLGANFMLPVFDLICKIGHGKSDICPPLAKQLLEQFVEFRDLDWLESVVPVLATLLYWGPRRCQSELKASTILDDVRWNEDHSALPEAKQESEREETLDTAERSRFYQEYLARVYMVYLLYQLRRDDEAVAFALLEELMKRYETIKHEREGVTNTVEHHYHLRIWIAVTHLLDLVSSRAETLVSKFLNYLRQEPTFATRLYIEWAVARLISDAASPARHLNLLKAKLGDIENVGKGTASLATIVNHLLAVLPDSLLRSFLPEILPCLLATGLAKQFTCRTFAQFVAYNVVQKLDELSVEIPCVLSPLTTYIVAHPDSVKGREKYANLFLLTEFHANRDLTIEFIHRGMLQVGLVTSDEYVSPWAFRKVASEFPVARLPKLYGSFTYRDKVWDAPPMKPGDLADPIPEGSDIQSASVQVSEDQSGVLQQKFKPWQVMLAEDVDLSRLSMLENRSARERTELIVVASLVQRPPNLGGLCRTAEIFNALKLVVHDASICNNSTFKSLAVTADKWLPLEEVKEAHMVNYLTWCKEKLGYSVVGLEQTSNSQSLETFKFPSKTLLILGKEREGIPAHILSLLDHVVEIKQYGLVRSLNVHVSGALVIHAYAKQHNR